MQTTIPLLARPDLHTERLDDELVVYAPESARAFVLNRTAAAIWQLCDGSMTAAELADELAEACGLSAEAARVDVQQFIEQLDGAGLLTREA
jgi:PqqD family protein of HPr-rel-A system